MRDRSAALGSVLILLAVLLGALITLVGDGKPLAVDAAWMRELVAIRSSFWDVPALVLNRLGGTVVGVVIIPVGVVIAFLVARRPFAAWYFLAASIVSALLVQLLKHLFGRARPEEILVHSDFGSFPSGHVANAATLSVALALILGRTWVWAAGAIWTVLMMLSRTYLGAHWLSDTVGGLLLGVGAALILWPWFAGRWGKATPDEVAPTG